MKYGLFDISDNYNRPKFWLARPNKRIITRLKELDNIVQFSPKLSGIDEVSGELPTVLIRNYESVTNPHIKHFKNKYLLKMDFMGVIEWFVIELISQNASEERDSIPFTAYNLAYNLRGKKLYNDKYEGKTIREVVGDMLTSTSWGIGKVSTEIGGKIRSFDEFGVNTNILEALNTVIDSYSCIMDFDSDKKLINFLHKDDYYLMKNLMLNDKNYIVSMERSMETTEIVTRLFPTGDEGLSINSVTPTGKSYIDRYDWFMYPFERDSNKKTIKSSDYMSDELCHAILNQQENIAQITPLVKEKTELMNESIDSLIPLEDVVDEKRLAYEVCEGILDTMRGNQEYEYSDFSKGSSYTFNYRKGWYAIQFRALNGTGTINIGNDNYLATTSWKTIKLDKSTLDALSEGEKTTITKLSGNVEFMCVRIPETEFKTFTDQQILDKYNIMQKKLDLDNATSSLENKKNYIDSLQSELDVLQLSVSDDKFYTLELLEERSEFIYEYHWEETTHTKAQELYDDSLEKMKELHKPTTNISTNIHNFLDSLEDKRNWKKLVLGSRVLMKHSRLGTYDEVMLTEITYDFSGGEIGLVLSDVRNLNEDEFKQLIIQGANASSTLNLNKHLYDNAVKQSETFDKILNSEWDAVKNAIVAGVNESVTFSNRGLVIKSPDKPKDLLIGTSGVLAISNDGGQTFKNAITKDGIVAERLVGKLIIGNKMVVRDDEGTLILNGSVMTVKDRNGVEQVKLGEYSPNKFGLQGYGKKNTITIDADKGFEIIRNSDKKQMLYLDDSGNAVFGGNLSAATGTFRGTLQGADGMFSGNLSAVGGTFTGTLRGVDGIFTGTLSGGSIETLENSATGKITLKGSELLSTKYGTNGKEYTRMENGVIEIRSQSEKVGSYQTVRIDGNYGIGISSDINSNSSLRMDVYETQSSNGLMTYRIAAKTETYKETQLLIESTSSIELKSQGISIGGSLYGRSADFTGTLNANYINMGGDRVATQNWSNNRYWVQGSSGYLSSSVYIGSASIGVGGGFDGSQSPANVSIGATNIYVPGTVYAKEHKVVSDINLKKNIEDYNGYVQPDGSFKTALDQLNDIAFKLYHFKDESDTERKHLGMILQESPLDVVGTTEAIDLYSMISLFGKAVQELSNKVKNLDHLN